MLARSERDLLIKQHLPLVRRLAWKTNLRAPWGSDLQEFFSIGAEACLESANRYDRRRGCSFSSFAHYRILGAMLDHTRSLSKRPCEMRLPDESVSSSNAISTELLAATQDHSPDPEHRAQEAETRQIILAAIRSLPERQQKVILLRYYEGKTIDEAGKKVSLSKARAWTELNSALSALREKLDEKLPH